jgi:hypothetical protein
LPLQKSLFKKNELVIHIKVFGGYFVLGNVFAFDARCLE